jgi:hypothetical protein
MGFVQREKYDNDFFSKNGGNDILGLVLIFRISFFRDFEMFRRCWVVYIGFLWCF